MKDKILEIKELKKNYHSILGEVEALKNITFDVYRNEFISIVGPSGCGKSTILSILADLEEKTGGKIKFTSEKCRLGYMLQQDCLFPWRTIFENCLLGLEMTKEVTEENKEYVLKLLKTYGLDEFIYKYPSSLSGGMRQRVALIRTLALNPDILLLDEPFSALDYQTRLTLSDDVYDIIKKEKKTAIMVTHDISEAISISNRIIVLSKRPAEVKAVYEIKLTDSSTPIHNRTCKEFADYYDKIWRDLDVQL